MRCIKLVIAYDGTSYCGWQRQLDAPTIQGAIEGCLEVMTQETITLNGAGRTDAGVHALGMVASFSSNSSIDCHSFFKGLNSLLPKDIRILRVDDVALDFHARFSCVGKEYSYIFSVDAIILPTRRLYVAHYPGDLDESVAQQCLDLLIGEHDFSSFEAMGSRDLSLTSGRGAVRTISRAVIEELPDEGQYCITIAGDGFLRHMVRNIAGTVIETALVKRSVSEFATVFNEKDRSLAGATAPASGLVLNQVFY